MATTAPGEEKAPSLGAASGEFGGAQPADRSASALQFQKYQMELTSRGSTLGMGLRVANDPTSQFSHPPMSAAQFGGGGNAKATFGGEQEM